MLIVPELWSEKADTQSCPLRDTWLAITDLAQVSADDGVIVPRRDSLYIALVVSWTTKPEPSTQKSSVEAKCPDTQKI